MGQSYVGPILPLVQQLPAAIYFVRVEMSSFELVGECLRHEMDGDIDDLAVVFYSKYKLNKETKKKKPPILGPWWLLVHCKCCS